METSSSTVFESPTMAAGAKLASERLLRERRDMARLLAEADRSASSSSSSAPTPPSRPEEERVGEGPMLNFSERAGEAASEESVRVVSIVAAASSSATSTSPPLWLGSLVPSPFPMPPFAALLAASAAAVRSCCRRRHRSSKTSATTMKTTPPPPAAGTTGEAGAMAAMAAATATAGDSLGEAEPEADVELDGLEVLKGEGRGTLLTAARERDKVAVVLRLGLAGRV